MKYQMVCIRDRIADVYGVPSFVHSIGSAIRGFGDEINRAAENNALYQHPDDFDLFVVGTYDDQTCEFESHVPRQIAVGRDLKK